MLISSIAILSECILRVILKVEAWEKRDVSEKSNNGEDFKKLRKCSLNYFFTLNSRTLKDVFTGSLQSAESAEILIEMLNKLWAK